MTPEPMGALLSGLWGFARDDVWAVGYGGVAPCFGRRAEMRWDGDDAEATSSPRATPLGDGRVMVSNYTTTWLYACAP